MFSKFLVCKESILLLLTLILAYCMVRVRFPDNAEIFCSFISFYQDTFYNEPCNKILSVGSLLCSLYNNILNTFSKKIM